MSYQLPWFKLYSEIIHDTKIKRLTVDEKWLWIVLLSLAASGPQRGVVCVTVVTRGNVTHVIPYENYELVDQCGYAFNQSTSDDLDPVEMVKNALKKFEDLGMILIGSDGEIIIKNFEKRQDSYLSDAERAKKYRDKKNNEHCVTNVTLEKRREEKRRIDNTPLPPKGGRLSNLFAQFWKAYPKRKSKGQAEKAWRQLNPDEQLTAKILQAVEDAKTTEDWLKDDGKFIPYPATWLRAHGWEDEHEVDKPPEKPWWEETWFKNSLEKMSPEQKAEELAAVEAAKQKLEAERRQPYAH